MAEINEEDLQAYLEEQLALSRPQEVEEEIDIPVAQPQQVQGPTFTNWDSYTSDPEYQTLTVGEKQELYDRWRQYATEYLASTGNLTTSEDIDFTKSFFSDIAKKEGLRDADYQPPSYAGQLIEQGQSGLRSFQSGLAGYGALIGAADPDEVASAIVSRNREEAQRYISPEFKEYSQKQLGFFGAAKELITNPFDLILPFFAQSFGSNLPALGLSLTAGAAGTAVGGPAVGAVTGLYTGAALGGATDAVVTVSQLINDEVRKRGLDPLKPEDVASVLKDPEFKERALKESAARGLAIGATGLASLGLGQIIARPAAEIAKLGAGAVAREGVRQLAIQTVAEPVGETAAQVGAQIATGQPIEIRGREIAEETFVGLPTAAVEAGALTYSNLVKNNAPSTANEVLRESVAAFRRGEFGKILAEPTTDQSVANFYDSLTIGEKAKTLGLAPNAILTQGQGSYANLSDTEKAVVGQAFEGAKQATAPAVTAVEAEAKAAEEAQKALEEVTAPVVEAPAPVAEAPAPVAQASAPVAEVPTPAPAPTPITEAPPIAEAPKAELKEVAPATAAVVEAEAPAPVAPAPSPAPAPTPITPISKVTSRKIPKSILKIITSSNLTNEQKINFKSLYENKGQSSAHGYLFGLQQSKNTEIFNNTSNVHTAIRDLYQEAVNAKRLKEGNTPIDLTSWWGTNREYDKARVFEINNLFKFASLSDLPPDFENIELNKDVSRLIPQAKDVYTAGRDFYNTMAEYNKARAEQLMRDLLKYGNPENTEEAKIFNELDTEYDRLKLNKYVNTPVETPPAPAPAPAPAPTVKEKSLDERIKEAADSQRGKPEATMMDVTMKLQEETASSPTLIDLLEHIGDLSNRAQKENAIVNVDEKIAKVEKYKKNNWGTLKKAIEQGYRENAEYRVLKSIPELVRLRDDVGKPGGPKGLFEVYEKLRKEHGDKIEAEIKRSKEIAKQELKKYVEAHEKFNKPITKLGKLGKDAAIALGNQDFNKLENIISEMRAWLDEYGKATPQRRGEMFRELAEKPSPTFIVETPAPTPTPAVKVLPPTKKQISALEKLGYLPVDITGLNRTQAKDIIAKQTPKVEAPKETPQVTAPAGAVAPAVAPAPVVAPTPAAPAQPAVGEAGGPVAPPTGAPATQETVEERLAKADQKLTAVLEKLGGSLAPDVKLDRATVASYFGGVPDEKTQAKVQSLLRLVTLGLSNAKQRLAKAKGAGRNLRETFTNIDKIVFTKDQQGGSGVYADPRNPFEAGTLYINPDQLTRALLTDLTMDPANFFASVIEEEVIHANHGKAMVRAFVQTFPPAQNPEIYTSPQATLDAFTKFYDAQNKEIENSLTLDQIKRVVGRYAQSLGIDMAGKTKEQIIQEFNVGRPGRLAEEYLRALIQERQLGSITEDQVKAYATNPVLRALGALRNWFRDLVGNGVGRESRKTFIDKQHDAILDLLLNSSQIQLRAAQEEANTAIPGKILASSIDPFAQELQRKNNESKKELQAEVRKELDKGGLWRRTIIGRLKKAYPAVDPAEVESLVYASVPEALGSFDEGKGTKFSTHLTNVANKKILREKMKTVRRQAREFVSFQAPGFYNVPTELRNAETVENEVEAEREDLTLDQLTEKIVTKAPTLEAELKAQEKVAPIIEERAIAAAYDPETGRTNIAEEDQELEELTLADGEQISSLDADAAEKRTAYIEAQLGEAGKLLAGAARALGLTKLETEILAYAADPKASVSTPNQVASILSRKQITDKYGLTNDQFDSMRDDVLTRMREQLGRAGVTRSADILAASIDPTIVKTITKQYDNLVSLKDLKKIVSKISSKSFNVQPPIKNLAKYIVNNPKWDWVFKSGKTDISSFSEIPSVGLSRTVEKIRDYREQVLGFYSPKEDAIYLNKDLIISSFEPPSRSKFLGKPTEQQSLELQNKTERYFNNGVSSTILHELIHKATSRISKIYQVIRVNIDIPESEKQGVRLAELLLRKDEKGKTFFETTTKDYREFKYLISQYTSEGLFKIFDKIEDLQNLYDQVLNVTTPEEKKLFAYELSDPEEFLAQTFSNPTFQSYLASIPIDGKVTAFQKLKQFIQELFVYISGQIGQPIKEIGEGSVLGEVLQTVSDLVEAQTSSPRIRGEPAPNRSIISLASSIDPTQSQALARAKTTLPKNVAAEVNAVIKDPFTDAQLERQAKDFVKANSPNGDVMHAKRILDGRPNMRFEERVATLAVIGKILRDRASKVENDTEKNGNSPERTALRQYLNTNLREVFSAAQELASRAGQELRAIRTANGIFLPYNWESLYTGPISDQQEQVLKYKQEVIQLKTELERLRAVLAKDAGNGISIDVPAGPDAPAKIRVTPRPPEAPIPEGENFYQLLSLFGDLAPIEGENFSDYLTRLGVPYDDVIAALEGVKAASVSATGVARLVPANLRSLPASEAIKQLVAIDKNFFGKLVSLRLKSGGGATQTEVTAGLQRKRTNVRERPIELQTVFDFFGSTESNKPTSKAPIEEETLPPLVRLAKYAADTITDRILRSLGVDKTKPLTDADTKLERQVRALVNAQFRQETNPVQASPEDTRSVEERLQDMVQRISLAETVFNQVKATLQEEIAFDNRARELKAENQLSPKQRADLEERAARTFNPNAINTLDSLLRKVIDFKAEARKHMTQRGASIESLQSVITQKFPNFSETQAQALAKFLGARYAKLVEDARSKQLANIVRRIGEKETAMPKSKMQQIFELINLGAFNDAAFYNAIAERYDLPEWDPAIAEEVRKRADKIQRLPKDSDQQLTESFLLNAFIANEHNKQRKGFEKVGRWLDVASSLWKAGVLSGFPTQLVNLGATHLNVLMELFAEANAYRKAAKAKGLDGKFNEFLATGLAAYFDSVGRVGAQQAGDAFATGLTRFRNEKQTELTPLENFTFDTTKPWKPSNYIAAWKIVGRAMAAADTYNAVIANEAKARMAARYSMLVDGLTADEATKRTEEIFDRNNATNKAIEEQVGQEETQGQFGSLAGLDPKSSAYRSEKRKIEAGKRRRYAQLREETVAKEANLPDLKEIRKFTEVATFNNQPQGLIGYIGGHIVGSMVGRVPILVPFAAFPRTIANIINAGLNYTPYGFARANGFSIGNAFGVVRDKGYAYAAPEKDSVEYHKLQTQALYGSIVTFTLIGLAMKDMDKDWDDAFFAVTGRGPANPEKREQLRLSGWVENSVKFGPLRFKHTDFPGLNTIFGAMGLISDEWRYGKLSERDFATVALTAALGIGNSIFDKQLLSGAKTLFEAVSDRGDASTKAKRVIQSYAGGFLNPGFARWMTKTFNIGADGMVGVTDTKELNSTVSGFLLGLTPAAVIAGKPALNRLGEPIREYPYTATMRRFGFVPEVKEHPVFTPLVRAGLFVPGASINLKINDFENGKPVQRKMDQAEFYNYSKYNGEYLRRRLTPQKAQALARLAERNEDAAQKQLEDLTKASKDYAKTRIEAEIRLNRRRK